MKCRFTSLSTPTTCTCEIYLSCPCTEPRTGQTLSSDLGCLFRVTGRHFVQTSVALVMSSRIRDDEESQWGIGMRSGDSASRPAQAAAGLTMRAPCLRAVSVAWLNDFHRSRVGVGMNWSVSGEVISVLSGLAISNSTYTTLVFWDPLTWFCFILYIIIVQQPSRHFSLNLAKIPPNQVIAGFGEEVV